MSADERARLRALAEKATPGPWTFGEPIPGRPRPTIAFLAGIYVYPSDGQWSHGTTAQDDAAYIAALSPDVVLALLDAADRAEAAERERDACRRSSESRWSTAVELTAALDAATAKRDAAKRLLAESLAISGSAVEAMRSERARADRLEAALRRIVDGVPPCANGEFFIPHYDQHGEPVGEEPVDPLAVVQSIVSVALAALAAPAPGGQEVKP